VKFSCTILSDFFFRDWCVLLCVSSNPREYCCSRSRARRSAFLGVRARSACARELIGQGIMDSRMLSPVKEWRLRSSDAFLRYLSRIQVSLSSGFCVTQHFLLQPDRERSGVLLVLFQAHKGICFTLFNSGFSIW
jgi:hypothetical protein